MLDTIFIVLDKDLDRMAGVVNRIVDTFKGEADKEKHHEILETWNGIKIEVCFPCPPTHAVYLTLTFYPTSHAASSLRSPQWAQAPLQDIRISRPAECLTSNAKL